MHPLAVRRKFLIGLPVQPRLLRHAALLERHRQVEVRVRVGRVEAERFAIARLRLGVVPEVVEDVAEVEVRLEDVGLERDRALVERLRFAIWLRA